jgi:hypothetical protein
MTVTDRVETHASNLGGNSNNSAKVTARAEVTWMMGIIALKNV